MRNIGTSRWLWPMLLALLCGWLLSSSGALAKGGGGNGNGNGGQHGSSSHDQGNGSNSSDQGNGADQASDQGQANGQGLAGGDGGSAQAGGQGDQTGSGNGANQEGPYDSTRDGSASENGEGDGNATGRPCAGCVGNADDKNPSGQLPNANSDGNRGYECDGNSGIGRTNPAHTGCRSNSNPSRHHHDNNDSDNDNNESPEAAAVAAETQPSATPTQRVAGEREESKKAAAERRLLGRGLPFTGLDVGLMALIGVLAQLLGLTGLWATRSRMPAGRRRGTRLGATSVPAATDQRETGDGSPAPDSRRLGRRRPATGLVTLAVISVLAPVLVLACLRATRSRTPV